MNGPPFENAQRYSPSPEMIDVIVANVLTLVCVIGSGGISLRWSSSTGSNSVFSHLGARQSSVRGQTSEFDSDPLIGGALASKRTAIPVPFTDLSIRFSTLPVLAVAIPILTLVWFFAGVTTVGVIGPETPDSDALVMVMLSAFGIFLSEGASTLLEYFIEADTAITTPRRRFKGFSCARR
ncbi:hypothetical protein [Halorubrum persicum]|uniref:hypothetical protein n=1 Tax=Halorubrum persicum TaxID=1383844 RepID=UPI001181AD0D|nr:hypothetical protein [Halorubrum persicum]